MANGHGGYRRPNNPAPVSGPGKLSRRTDGRQPTRELPNAKYGENAAFEAAQGAAPMSGDIGSGGMAASGAIAPDLSGLVSMGAPSQRPDEPITAGLSGMTGGGPSIAQNPFPLSPEKAAELRSYLPVLIVLASQPNADANTKAYVRQLRAELG